MKGDQNNLSRADKILLFLYEFGKGTRAKIRYEDIVVGLFKKYPHDFQLKGYTEYPDSGDLVHKPLYDFKKKGYVDAVNKVFSLTDRGVELAQQRAGQGHTNSGKTKDRLSRSSETEIVRIKGLEGYELFCRGEKNKLSDNDFYNYLGVTVRTNPNSFKGRMESINAFITEIKQNASDPVYANVLAYHDFLTVKHSDIIEYFSK